ncbi:cation:proton antiporter domain-containing protein [Rhodobacter maris]|uniref:Kef-type potassium/proton antiporter (CPA2 family) n=1 Tax=Rhodobacter maris TaxID=446682 RepID=A0A285S0W1_9RHOB|nr:cation:proton antiporter [Rhodobacter maris]SOC00251.1 Kef-type potassium/proton antiporter (CPA2 family) [Rhodobacter maris]
MTDASHLGFYRETLIFLGTAGVVLPLMTRFRVSPVVGFLVAGLLLGPNSAGRLTEYLPFLGWFTISSQEAVDQLAELGVAFLLFNIGLELSLDRLWTMRRVVFGLGMAQVVLTTVAIALTAWLFGNPIDASLVIGACLALSSTAIVLQLLADQRRLTTISGRNIFGVLLAQDLAVVPILFLIVVFGDATADGHSVSVGRVLGGLGTALLQAVAAIGLIVGFGRLILRRLFRQVAHTQNRELFMATILFVVVGTSLVTRFAGLSMALGAFLAGLLLAETEFRRQVAVDIEPFKGLLLGLFFISVGMRIDPAAIAAYPVMVVVSVVGMTALKAAVMAPLARAFGIPWPRALEAALLLAGGGEFAFLVLSMAGSSGLTSREVEQFMLLVASGTMLLTPLLAKMGRRVGTRAGAATAGGDAVLPDATSGRVLVVGHGRVGRLIDEVLAAENFDCLVIDRDADLVRRGRERGREVVFGDAARAGFLRRCGLAEAPAVILTMHDPAAAEAIVTAVRAERPDVPIIVRAQDADHAVRLFARGASHVIPEAFETSLELLDRALGALGVAEDRARSLLADRRTEMMRFLRREVSAD